ncbi:MAG TPA: hypothetical protein VE398_05510 [Acidobacteriota bacterium]|nr:hypothetical protein [Acidobacteriota bacterium]
MALMRQFATRLVTILLFGGSVLFLPLSHLSARPPLCAKGRSTAGMDSCPMCRNAGPGHECSCCDHGNCTCRMSSSGQDEVVPGAARPGVLCAIDGFPVILESAPLLLRAIPSTRDAYLRILTPPPKA